MRSKLSLFAILLWAPPARVADIPRAQYRIETVAGSSLIGDGGLATLAQIGAIQGIAVDGRGNLYVSDTDNHRVRKVDSGGIITTVAGTGTRGFTGDGAAATDAQLNLPYGLAADSSGALYVADLGNNRVRRIGPDGIIATVAGNGTAGSAGDGGPATSAELLAPRNVALDSAGNLYISEFDGHRVRKVLSSGLIATVAGTGVAGFRGDGGAAVAAQLAYPAGLAVDPNGDLYIADSGNLRIRKVLPNGLISTALGGSQTIVLYTPLGVAVDASGAILVGDVSNTVRAYTTAGVWTKVAGTGAAGFSGDGGPATKALLASVRDIAVAGNGNLYIADGVRVRRVDNSGIIWTAAGNGLNAVGDGGSALAANLSGPSAAALDYAGNLYIADPGTQRVRKVDPNNVIQTLAGIGVAGAGGELVPGTVSALNTPMGVAVDPSGMVYVADTDNHRIRAVSANGYISTVAGTGNPGTGAEGQPWLLTPLRGPRGVCIDRAGALYIVDTGNHRVLRAAPGASMATAAGNGSPGYTGDGGQGRLAQLNQPGACALDTAGDLFIADTLNHRIRKVASSGAISTVAGTGQAGTCGDEGPAAAACLNAPSGVAADDNGNIFIADTGNHVVRQVTADGVIHLIAGQYEAGFAGDGGAATSAKLDAPAGLILDGAGDLYLADSGNNRVRRLVPTGAVPLATAIVIAPISVVSAASLRDGPVAPGEIVTIFGTGLGPDSGVSSAFDASGRVLTSLGGAQVTFNGVAAPLFYVQAGQINAQVPYTVAGQTLTKVSVSYQGNLAGSADLAIAIAAPAVFPAVVNQDGSINQDTSPAPRGGVITFYATGAGLTSPTSVEGVPAEAPYAQPRQSVSVTVAGAPAEILFAASAPGMVGVLQVNARVPAGLSAVGQQTLTLSVGGAASPDMSIWLN
jgi:uncharacterized protein (TIGR03437 family)